MGQISSDGTESAVGQPGQRRPDPGAAAHREGAGELPAYVLVGFPLAQRPLAFEVGVGISDNVIRILFDLGIRTRDLPPGYAACRHEDLRPRSSPYTYMYQ